MAEALAALRVERSTVLTPLSLFTTISATRAGPSSSAFKSVSPSSSPALYFSPSVRSSGTSISETAPPICRKKMPQARECALEILRKICYAVFVPQGEVVGRGKSARRTR
jgi:hypothetical protein